MARKTSLQDIADSLGISRGTVDRAIHGRGRINPETREKVIEQARRLGYIDRKVDSFLPLQSSSRIYAMVPGEDPFFKKIEDGITKAVNEFMPRPEFEMLNIGLGSPEKQCEILFDISERAALEQKNTAVGILIVPSEDEQLRDAIKQAEDSGVRIAALNTDSPDSGRSFFIGQDLYASGRTAAELMMHMTDGPVAVLSGFQNIWGHSERVRGFIDVYRENGLTGRVIGPYYTHDSRKETGLILKKMPDKYSGIFTVSGLTTEGAGKYLCSRPDIPMVGFDCTAPNIKLLKSGSISCLISQSPQLQGFLAARRLMQLLRGEAESQPEDVRIPIDIYFKENIDFYRNHLEL